jgi:hypothetical protein
MEAMQPLILAVVVVEVEIIPEVAATVAPVS